MTDITSALKKIQIEEVKFGQPISEYTTTKIGANINYIYDNYQPVSFVNVGQIQDSAVNKTLTFLAPYRCKVLGFRVVVMGSFSSLSLSGTITRTNTFTSSFTTGGFVVSRTVTEPAISTVDISGTISEFGTYHNFDSAPSAITPVTLEGGDSCTLTYTTTGSGLFSGSQQIEILIQKELAP